MSKKKMSMEDRILWGKVARSVHALPGRMDTFEEFEVAFEGTQTATDGQMEMAMQPQPTASSTENPSSQKRNYHHPIERPVKRKISKGRLPLEARIDLHGLVQSEAHGILLQFLVHAHERGLRHVLVITGKGSSVGSEGALRRAVPMWFSKPEFRFLISGYEPAARNHGGDGALYVRLSRRKG